MDSLQTLKIIPGGYGVGASDNDLLVLRLLSDGTPDNSFSGDGKVAMDLGYGQDLVEGLAISGNQLYLAGRTAYGPIMGFLAALALDAAPPLLASIPDSRSYDLGTMPNTVYTGFTPAEQILLNAQASGGTPPYQYVWNNGAATAGITVSPTAPQTYSVTVTDALGMQSTASKRIEVVDVRCGNKNDKLSVCKTQANHVQTLCIAAAAVRPQLQNGASLGSCSGGWAQADRIDRENTGLRVYPNPSRSGFEVLVTDPVLQDIELRVFDATGRLVERMRLVNGLAKNFGNSYRPGIYLLEARCSVGPAVMRIIRL